MTHVESEAKKLYEIEVLPFWMGPTPREIRLKKLNVSPTLYCNVLPLTVYFIRFGAIRES